MSSYIIEGGKRLQGETYVSGSKNAALPIMAASILNKGITKLYNMPNIHDTQMMIEILKSLGCKVKKHSNKVVIDSSKVTKFEIPENLMREMRSSVILAGGIVGRYKKATFSYPGGCDIGARPIDLHLKAFEKMGIKVEEQYGKINCYAEEINRRRNKFRISKCRSNRKYNISSSISKRNNNNYKCSNGTRNS